MSKLLGAYTGNGSIDTELWYTTLFDEIPCKYTFNVEDSAKHLDIESIAFDRCKHLFNNILAVRQIIEETVEEPDVEEIEYAEENHSIDIPILMDSSLGCALTIVTDHRIIYINYCKCVVLHSHNDNLDEIKKLVQALWECFPKEKEEEKLARVGLIKYSQGEYYTSFSDIKKTHINIEENYNDDFLPVYKDMIDFLNQRESGLILAWGNPGTGNYYIKIIWNFQSNCVPLCHANTTQLHRGTSS